MKRIIFLGLALWTASHAAHGETYFVHPISHMGDFPTIQAAVDYVQDGDIIELGDGIFQGDGNRDIDFLSKGITVRSQSGDPQACIIDCEGSASAPHRGFTLVDVGANAAIEGITIENGYHGSGGALLCYGDSSPLILKCILRFNSGVDGGAFYNWVDAFPRFIQCTFAENSAYESGGGMCI